MNTEISVFCYELKLLLREHNAGADEVAWQIKFLKCLWALGKEFSPSI